MVNGKNQLTATITTQTVRFAGTVSANSVVTLDGQSATGSAGALTWEKTITVATGTNRRRAFALPRLACLMAATLRTGLHRMVTTGGWDAELAGPEARPWISRACSTSVARAR